MTVLLRLYRKIAGQPAEILGEREFAVQRVTIGRSAECALVLEDPKKWVSRVHAEIAAEGEALWVTVVSKVNPVFVNGERHGPGARSSLRAGDRLEIGEYEIELLPPPAPLTAPPPAPPAADTTLIVEPVPEMDFVLEAGTESAGGAEPREITAAAQEPEPEPRPRLDSQPEAAPPPEPVPAAAASPPASGESVFAQATALGAAPAPELFDEPTFIGKEIAGKQAPSVEDSILVEVTQLRSQVPPPEPGIFEDEETAGEQTAPQSAAQPADLPEPTFIGAPSPPADSPQGLAHAVNAFLEGAGLPARTLSSPEEMERFLRQSGAIVRAAIEGVMALLAARAEAKKEFRAEDRTMVASRDNNPLKLMAEPQDAIEFLFDTKERSGGFLPPLQAVSDAFDDVRAHEAALIAGMRAAILGALQRFDPKRLEEELARAAGGLGLNRKAKLWDLFCAYQQKLTREAEDDFNKAFGRDFIAGYTAQLRELRRK